MPSLFEIGPEILEEKMKMWKVYDDNENKNANANEDDGQKHTWAFGSGEPKKTKQKVC